MAGEEELREASVLVVFWVVLSGVLGSMVVALEEVVLKSATMIDTLALLMFGARHCIAGEPRQ